jgi:hypothetical protein
VKAFACWIAAVCLTLAGCAQHAPQPGQITKVVLSRNVCDQDCRFEQFALSSDGFVRYNNGLRFEWRARVPHTLYKELVSYLVAVPAFGPKSSYLSEPSQQPQTTIYTEYAGTHAQVSFPTTDSTASADRNVNVLNGWSRFAARDLYGTVLQAHQKAIPADAQLQNVVFESDGCFGRCPAYTAAFSSDGTASLRNARNVGSVGGNATARVSFGRVRQILDAAGYRTLLPEYPLRWIDVYGVRFRFRYRTGATLTVDAPDRTQWSPQVAELTGAFQQLVRDTDWRR